LTEPLQVGQFAIVDHEPVDRGPNAGVFHGKGPTDDRAELFILAEGTTPAGEAFAGHVVSALGQAFTSIDMSLTGSLRRLYIEAERALHDWNAKSIAQHRVSIGLTAFGRRGGQAVIAQAGPSIAYLLHDGAVQAYASDAQHNRAIGSGPVDPQLTRVPFGPGDRLLLISTTALNELDEELLAGILMLDEDQVLPDLYRRIQHMRHVTVVLVTGPVVRVEEPAIDEVDDDFVIDATPPRTTAQEGPMFQPSLFIEDEAEQVVQDAKALLVEITPRRTMASPIPAEAAEVPAPLLRASGDTTASINRIAAEGQARAARSRAAVATIVGETAVAAGRRPAWHSEPAQAARMQPMASAPFEPMPPSSGRKPRKSQSFTRGLNPGGSAPARPDSLGDHNLPMVDDLAAVRTRAALSSAASETIATQAGAAINSGGSLVRVRTSMGGRWKGNGSFGGGTTSGRHLPPTWMFIAGVLGALLTLALLVTVPRMFQNDDAERLTLLIDGAQQRAVAASQASDATAKRATLTEAQVMLLEAREIDSGNAQATEMLTQIQQVLSVMDNVLTPQAVEPVASLQQFGDKPVAVARMAVSGQSAYVLDGNSGQVIALPLGGGEPRVVFAEQKDAQKAKPIALAILEQSDSGSPVVLVADSENHVWAYRDGTFGAIAFNAPGNLKISDIAVQGRDLYVLDASATTVYRFLQANGEFPNEPIKALVSPELAGARRLMVDGEIMTSDADGAIHRFLDSKVVLTLSQGGIDKPLAAPETPQVLNETEVAILDAVNDRIVVLRRDGAFDRQYRHKDFQAASALVVHDGQVYVFSAGQLRRVVL